MLNIESNFFIRKRINNNNMLLITSPMDQFEVRSLLSFDVSNIDMYLIISFWIILILNILVANNKLVYNYWSYVFICTKVIF